MGVSTAANHAANDLDAGMAAMNRDLQDKGFLLTSTEDIINWARTGSLHWMTFGLACCAVEMMHTAMPEQDYPGGLYLLLILHYVEQECLAESSAVARPRNETVEQVRAYLAANYRQKFSLTEVAARFYLSPYYLSRLFRRVTGQSIVDYLNNRRIEAAQKLLETTELSISAIAEQTGFASAAHFRRVFREVTDISPLQYRKKQKK